MEAEAAATVNENESCHRFTKLENFDTDVLSCLTDPKKALSYQTGLFGLAGLSVWPWEGAEISNLDVPSLENSGKTPHCGKLQIIY